MLLTACNSSDTAVKEPHIFPKPGTVVASAQMPVTGDTLNHFTFSIKVVADSQVAKGVYDVDADYGPNFAGGELTLPKGAEAATPYVRQGNEPNSFIIGFRLAGDTTAYDYYQVSSNGSQTEMRYIKAYTF